MTRLAGRGFGRYLKAIPAAMFMLVIHWSDGGCSAAPAAPAAERNEYTNVILVSLDILRPDHLGAYGYPKETSPQIDRLAKQSVLFENAIAHSYLTPVAHMSVITGQYPRNHGMVSFEVSKNQVSQRTLPEILKLYGYQTAAVVSSPEFFMRYDTESGKIVNPKDIFSHAFDYYGRTVPDATGSVRVNPTAALDWLKANKDRKFFLWIETGMLHPPYSQTVPMPYKTQFDPPGYTPFYEQFPIRLGRENADRGVPTEVLFHVYRGNYYLDFQPIHKLTEKDVSFINGRYDAGVYYTDTFIGDLLNTLDALKLSGKTLVIFHSIHGESLGEHGYFFHHDVFDTEVKTALTMRFPDNSQAGKRISRQVQGIDILPTILDYLQIPINHESQGASLMPLIKGDEAGFKGSEYAFIDRLPWWEYVLGGWHLEHQSEREAQYTPLEIAKMKDYRNLLNKTILGEYPPECIAVRTNKWKLILREKSNLLENISWWNFISGKKFPVDSIELFDLDKDPMEQKNVAKDHPKVVEQLKAKLLEWDASIKKNMTTPAVKGQPLIIPYP
ncbi:iduronate 2-sulfatase [Geobacter sp. OR-1]|uniref:sulfatase n=1 Tax=Geobacter sp. OR-1 TaxID=1266765 RepID=UPI0005426942|nr:sulfatase [Geobacter sp. OR-1]GAM09275.1 iduronate 2-sulfatase [Geobacter sp. OR-1]